MIVYTTWTSVSLGQICTLDGTPTDRGTASRSLPTRTKCTDYPKVRLSSSDDPEASPADTVQGGPPGARSYCSVPVHGALEQVVTRRCVEEV